MNSLRREGRDVPAVARFRGLGILFLTSFLGFRCAPPHALCCRLLRRLVAFISVTVGRFGTQPGVPSQMPCLLVATKSADIRSEQGPAKFCRLSNGEKKMRRLLKLLYGAALLLCLVIAAA